MSIFRKSLLTIGAEGQAAGADLSDIDLRAAALDSRIKYQCDSQRAYYASDGTIKYADPDTWPLEYRDNVAIGRHEPEPRATNIVKYNQMFADAAGWGVNESGSVIADAAIAPDGTTTAEVNLKPDVGSGQGVFTRTFYAGSADTEITFSGFLKTNVAAMLCYAELAMTGHDPTVVTEGPTWQRFRTGINAGEFMGNSGTVVAYTRDSNVGAGAVISGWAWQVETGSVATSPILTDSTSVTRAAASVSVINPGGVATSLRVHYSDGTSRVLDFNGMDEVGIPLATTDWGTRYISKCEYLKA